MSEPRKFWSRPFTKVLLLLMIPTGLYLFTFFVSRSVVESLYKGIETSRATGLSALAPSPYHFLPAYRSADGLLQAGGMNVTRAIRLALDAPRLEVVESQVMEIARQSGGFLDEFKVHRQSNMSPWLDAKLRVPAKSLESTLATLRSLGTVKQETEASENTEAEKESLNTQLETNQADFSHLSEIVKHHAGSLNDTVAAAEKLSERRKEANKLETQLKELDSRIEYAVVALQIVEEYRARLEWRPASAFSDLRNSLIEGLEVLLASFGAVLGFLLRYGLVLAAWTGLLYWPSRAVWQRVRRIHPAPSSNGA